MVSGQVPFFFNLSPFRAKRRKVMVSGLKHCEEESSDSYRILEYSEDDCRVTMVLKDGIERLAAAATTPWTPPTLLSFGGGEERNRM